LNWRERRNHPERPRCHPTNSNQLQGHNSHKQPSNRRNHSTQTRTARRHRTTRAPRTPSRRRRTRTPGARLRAHERRDSLRALRGGGGRRTPGDGAEALRPRRRVVQADSGLAGIQIGEDGGAGRGGRQRRRHRAEDGGEGGGWGAAAERRAHRADDAAVRVLRLR